MNSFEQLEKVEKRHLHFKEDKMKTILKVQMKIFEAAREYLKGEEFTEMLPPILSSATDPGLRGAEHATVDFYGKTYKLMGSMLLHKQMALTSMDKIFAISPNVRLEDPVTKDTGRHLAEFWQLDLEAAHTSYDEIMKIGEGMVTHIIKKIKECCPEELEEMGRELKIPSIPFMKMTHDEAITKLKRMGYDVHEGEEISWEAEKALSAEYEEPFWIVDYPDGSRGFYDKFDEESGDKLRDFDLIYPEGYGEAISGGEREHTKEGITRQMKKIGEDPEDYGWYLEMLEEGVPPSAGFGIGIERLTRFTCGLETVWRASPFCKVPGIYSP
ncbi:MAG: asparagine synthetase A [Candidatus Aenigmatarchaeota archaeon]